MTDNELDTTLSESAARGATQTSEIIGTMLLTRTYYEHDGVDTTDIDRNIEQLTEQLKRFVKLQRAYIKEKQQK